MAAKNRRASPENVRKCTENHPGESGTGENTPQSLTYVSWENVQNLLRTAKHSLHLEHDLFAERAAIEKQYAESLEKVAGELRVALRTDPLLEYGPHKDILWGMAEEAISIANYHSRVARDLLDDAGPCESIKRLRNQTHHKKLALPVNVATQEIEELHHHHRSIYGPLLSDIINANVILNKYEKKMKGACDLGDKLQHAQVKFRGPISHDQRLRVQREETELLNKESAAVCLLDQYNSRVRRIQAQVIDLLPKSEDFMAKIMQREEDRLNSVFTQMSHYLKCIGITEAEQEKHDKIVEDVQHHLLTLDPSEITWNWQQSHVEKINLPEPKTNNSGSGQGVVKTLLVPKHNNPYGHREKISELFQANTSPNRAERAYRRSPEKARPPSSSMETQETSPAPTSSYLGKIERRTPSRRRKPVKSKEDDTKIIDLEGLTSDLEEQLVDTGPTDTNTVTTTKVEEIGKQRASQSRRKGRQSSESSGTTKKDRRHQSPASPKAMSSHPRTAWESDSSNDTF